MRLPRLKYPLALILLVAVYVSASCGDSLNFLGLSSYAELREIVKAETGFYAEARNDESSLGAADALESWAYTTHRILNEIVASDLDHANMSFHRACESGRRIVIGAVGDVLLHQPLAEQGMRESNGYRSLWMELEPDLKRPDFMYANLEGPTAGAIAATGRRVTDPGEHFDHVAYTSYPMFNYSPALIGDLRSSGIDVVSTANNHAMDRHPVGADRTIEQLKKQGLPFTGTRSSAEAAAHAPEKTDWTVVTENKGFRIGWVACTFGTNGISDPNSQVLRCFEQRDIVLAEIRRLRADPAIDAVIATPHWGIEYDHVPGADQRKLAREMVEAGALIVLGNHPHVLQPVERLTATDGHEGYVIYSLGNFVSGQKGVAKRSSALIYVGLTKNARGEVFVNGARHLPLAMMYTPNGLKVEPARGNFPEGLALVNRILSRSTEISPEEALVTNPGCP